VRSRTSTEEFEAAALPHLPYLFRTAVRLAGDRGRAEDAVQDAYLQAWKSFHRFTPGTNCRAWLFKILINTLHHSRRKALSQ
jgi:RNA polymerase sigma-70 factor, ECF subfamily